MLGVGGVSVRRRQLRLYKSFGEDSQASGGGKWMQQSRISAYEIFDGEEEVIPAKAADSH